MPGFKIGHNRTVPAASIAERECRPNAGKRHATSLFVLRPITHTHRAPALFALRLKHRRFECPKCNSVQNEAVASDPMQSVYVGWIAGELRAPN
jgi:hypothetical protein